jgi:hypothetical protein
MTKELAPLFHGGRTVALLFGESMVGSIMIEQQACVAVTGRSLTGTSLP